MIVLTSAQVLMLAAVALIAVVVCARAYYSLHRALDRAEQQLRMIREDIELSEGEEGPRVLPRRKDITISADGSPHVVGRYSRKRR